jgi:hypothetical protein
MQLFASVILLTLAVMELCCAQIRYTPVIGSITPNTGSVAGGTEIYIRGAGLLNANGVMGTFAVFAFCADVLLTSCFQY